MAKQKSRVNDTSPLHLSQWVPHDANPVSINQIGGTDVDFNAPDASYRFARVVSSVDSVVSSGTNVNGPATLTSGCYPIFANAPEWIQLIHDADGVEIPHLKISGLSAAGTVVVTWHK